MTLSDLPKWMIWGRCCYTPPSPWSNLVYGSKILDHLLNPWCFTKNQRRKYANAGSIPLVLCGGLMLLLMVGLQTMKASLGYGQSRAISPTDHPTSSVLPKIVTLTTHCSKKCPENEIHFGVINFSVLRTHYFWWGISVKSLYLTQILQGCRRHRSYRAAVVGRLALGAAIGFSCGGDRWDMKFDEAQIV